jgi:hypothetical protein
MHASDKAHHPLNLRIAAAPGLWVRILFRASRGSWMKIQAENHLLQSSQRLTPPNKHTARQRAGPVHASDKAHHPLHESPDCGRARVVRNLFRASRGWMKTQAEDRLLQSSQGLTPPRKRTARRRAGPVHATAASHFTNESSPQRLHVPLTFLLPLQPDAENFAALRVVCRANKPFSASWYVS